MSEPASETPHRLLRAQQQLHDSEQTFRAIFDSALDAMVIADDDGKYLDANPAARELFGLPKVSLLGHTAADFAAPGFDFAVAWGAFRESYQERGEFHLARPDGSVRQTEYNAVTNFCRDGTCPSCATSPSVCGWSKSGCGRSTTCASA